MTLERILQDGFCALSLPLDESALSRYRRYAELLAEKNAVMNLTAIEGEENVARLHFLDCAALLASFDLAGKRVIDVGSGAGFPGLALKIACPTMDLTLLESLEKRVAFLRECCEALELPEVECLRARAEEAIEARGAYDVACSRAVARLRLLCELCLPLVKVGGLFLAMKGTDCAEEIDEARHAIDLLGGRLEGVTEYAIPGTEIRHAVVAIRKVAETPARYPRTWAQIKKKPL